MIDIEKFIGDVYKLASVRANHELCHALRYAFSKQGLEYKDGKIVKKEPKFKKGDWVVYCNVDVDLITGIEENGYTINEGGFIPFACEDSMQSWDITLAKDGDVLADGIGVILFRKIGNARYKNVIDFYGNTNGRRFEKQEGFEYWGDVIDCNLHPATKEQRDTLMRAMADAGYTFDFENKQLKKVEQELTEFENIVEEIADTAILNAYGVKELANRLRSNAKKQLQEEFDKQLEKAYNEADKVQYKRGYRKAIEDAREWLAWYTGDRQGTLVCFDDDMERKLKKLSQG